jgi:hypothetical protein
VQARAVGRPVQAFEEGEAADAGLAAGEPLDFLREDRCIFEGHGRKWPLLAGRFARPGFLDGLLVSHGMVLRSDTLTGRADGYDDGARRRTAVPGTAGHCRGERIARRCAELHRNFSFTRTSDA